MKHIAQSLRTAFERRMEGRQMPSDDRREFLLWLRFYLDFCFHGRSHAQALMRSAEVVPRHVQ